MREGQESTGHLLLLHAELLLHGAGSDEDGGPARTAAAGTASTGCWAAAALGCRAACRSCKHTHQLARLGHSA
jgi:hypothetical protein